MSYCKLQQSHKKATQSGFSQTNPCEVRNFRRAVTSKPQPVALSTTVGTKEVAGCA